MSTCGVSRSRSGSTSWALRRTILEIVRDAEQVISYLGSLPSACAVGRFAGFKCFKQLSDSSSGSVLPQLADELEGHTMTKSAPHFPAHRPLPKTLVKKLIAVRLGEEPALALARGGDGRCRGHAAAGLLERRPWIVAAGNTVSGARGSDWLRPLGSIRAPDRGESRGPDWGATIVCRCADPALSHELVAATHGVCVA